MNILHINLADQARGAAAAALRLRAAQAELGHSSRLLVGHKFTDHAEIAMLPARDSAWQKGLYRFVYRFEELSGLQYLWQPWKKQFLRHPFTRQADVINLHNIHNGYFSHTILPRLGRRAPLVWTLHDLWSITGHCGSPFIHDCERWRTGCGRCPALDANPGIAIDTTALLWRIKRRIYERCRFTLVAPSEWLAQSARESPLLGRFEALCIPHGLDTGVFQPTPREEARRALGIPPQAKVVLFAAFDLFQTRKGGVYLFDALQRLVDEGLQDLLLVTVGSERASLGSRYRIPLLNLGLIRDERALARCYSAADVYAGPSLAETFGLVYIESMACGTPVVAFDCTAVPEVVRHQETGYLARNRDVDDLTAGIRLLLSDDALRERLGRQGREMVLRDYTLEQQARRYLDVYQRVIEEWRGAGTPARA
jgi:glycosyltransferase involved in cell wall biosynthesis